MKNVKNLKRKASKLFLLIVLLGITVGFALLSTVLTINGSSRLFASTWDIHWDDVTLLESAGSVEASSPARVIDNEKKLITFETALNLPGDYYEFTVDAINEGDINGKIKRVDINFFEADGETQLTLPDEIIYTFKYADGTDVAPGQVLEAGASKKYRFRLEYDKDTVVPIADDVTVKTDIEIEYEQTKDQDTSPYIINFDANGGSVNPTSVQVERGNAIGTLPIPTKANSMFDGWWTDLSTGVKVTAAFIPVSSATLKAKWVNSYAQFNTGQSVNTAFKGLAGDDVTGEDPYKVSDTYITSIVRSENAPASGTNTVNVEANGSTPILAWYENGTIKIYSEAEALYLNSDASYMFYNMTNATSIYTNYKTSNTTNMKYLFGSVGVTSLDVSSFDTSNVTNMNGMFAGIKATSLNVSNLDTSSVTDMSAMFASSSLSSLDLSTFDTRNVETMSAMFAGTNNLTTLNVSSFETPKLTDVSSMFAASGPINNVNLSSFDASHITNTSFMFGSSNAKNVNISGWNFASATSLAGMFSNARNLESVNLENVNTSNITNMNGMFSNCSKVENLDVSSFDISNVTDLGTMFSGMTYLQTLDISGWDFAKYNPGSLMMYISGGGFSSLKTFILDNVKFPASMEYGLGGLSTVEEFSFKNTDTTRVTNMSSMFNGDSSVTELNLSSFDTRNVLNMGSMFNGCSNLTKISVEDIFVVDQVTTSGGMFYNDTNLVGGKGTTYDSNHIDKEYAHYDGGEADPGYFSKAVVINYTVTFNPNGGSVNPTTKQVEGGTKIGELPVPTKNGSSYTGWWTDDEDGTKVTKNTKVTSDITIYAQWVDDIEVIYDGNDGVFGNNNTNTVTYKYNANTEKYSGSGYAEPTRTDYKFIGWNTESNGSGISYNSVNEIIDNVDVFTSPKRLYAMWQKIHTVTFNPNGGTVNPTSRRVLDGEVVGLLPTPENNNIPFLGWYTDLTDGTVIDRNIVVNDTETYYAHWANSYTVFDTGKVVNAKFKSLAGDTLDVDYPYSTSDQNVLSIERSTTAPPQGTVTENVEATGNTPIVAWFDNGVIKYYTEADDIFLNADASYMFNEFEKVTNIDTSFYTSNTTNMSYLFNYCKSISSIDVSKFNTSRVTDFGYMFYGCQSVESLDISNFDTSSFTNMYNIFGYCDNLLELNVSNIDYSGVVSEYSLFENYMGLWASDDLRKLVLDNSVFPANMRNGLYDLYKLEEISLKNVDTSHVTTMENMFYGLANSSNLEEFVLDLSSFDTSNVTNMERMFQSTGITSVNLSSFNTSNVTNMLHMFESSKLKSLDLSNFDISRITITGSSPTICYNCEQLETLNISNLNFSNSTNGYMIDGFMGYTPVRNMKHLIADNIVLPANSSYALSYLENLETISLKNVDTSNVTNMNHMFYYDKKLREIDLSNFDTRSVTDMTCMFGSMGELKIIIVGDDFKVSRVASSSNMFDSDPKLVGGKGTVYDSNHTDKAYAHYDGGVSNPGYFNNGATDIYTVTFDANGGTVSSDKMSIIRTQSIGDLPTPVWLGHTFEGWYIDVQSGIEIDSTYVPDKDIKLTAKWSNYNGWFFENEDDFDQTGEPLTSQKWKYFENSIPIENGIRELNDSYKETVSTNHYYWFKNGYSQVGWYEENGNKYFFSWYDENNDGYVDRYRLEDTTKLIDGVEHDFDENGVCTRNCNLTGPVDFATSSWDEIIDAYNRNDLEDLEKDMKDGKTREVQLDLDGDGMPETTRHLRIVNLTTPSSCYNSNFSQTACGFVVEFADIITTHRINPYDRTKYSRGYNNIGGWEYSEARSYVNSVIYEALPQEIKDRIIPVKAVSGYGPRDNRNFTTTDKLYYLAPHEIWSDRRIIATYNGYTHTYDTDTAYDQTRQLDYYQYKNTSMSNPSPAIKEYNGTAKLWDTRSPWVGDGAYWYRVESSGLSQAVSVGGAIGGVSPSFRIR